MPNDAMTTEQALLLVKKDALLHATLLANTFQAIGFAKDRSKVLRKDPLKVGCLEQV